MITFTIDEKLAKHRLDRVLAERLGISANEARRIIDRKLVHVSRGRVTKSTRLALGDTVQVDVVPQVEGGRVVAMSYAPTPEEGELDVLFKDDALIVLNKPPNVATHPLNPGEGGTLANRLAARFPECVTASTDPRDGGFVHRLDRDTTGVIIAARTRESRLALRAAFSEHDVNKVYWALVHGELAQPTTIDAALETRGGRAHVAADGLTAKTAVRTFAHTAHFSFIEAKSSTGRMHQIRVHLAHIGHPLVGDALYGAPLGDSDVGVQLHARAVTLPHPTDRWLVTYAAPLPTQRCTLAEQLLKQSLREIAER